MKGYLGFAGHLILDLTMKSVMIALKKFSGCHTAENILQKYQGAVAYYNISENNCNIISENASNMTMVCDLNLPGYFDESEKVHDIPDNDAECDDNCGDFNHTVVFPTDDFPKNGRCFAQT